jgi:hypothetical protein
VAEQAREGNIYSIDLGNGKPAHYWILLNDPQAVDGSFLAVSFTDRHNLPSISDVWQYNYRLCATLRLSKPSVIALPYAVVKQQTWLNELDAEFVCLCADDTLKRARCNFYWFQHLLKPNIRKYVNFYAVIWNADCGTAP